MELYGLASAFLHDNEDDSKLHIYCNPISMVDGQRENFKLVKDLAYKETVDLTDIEGSCRAFTKFITTWENVAKRQEAGLEKNLKDLPIAFMAGDAAFNRINLNALFVTFFGQRFSESDPDPHALSDAETNEFMRLLQTISKKYENVDEYTKAKAIVHDPDAIKCTALMNKIGSNKKGMSKALVDKVSAAREAYLKEHGTYPPEFIEACGKLPSLLEGSFYHHGRYSNSGGPPDKEAPDFTNEIKSLQKPFEEGDAEAFKGLETLAAALGNYYGMEYTRGSHTFKLGSPKNFANDPELQKNRPELAFFHWRDAKGDMPFRRAFHEAFQKANWHPSYRYIKLPMDGNNPLYTDPVADMMVEIFQIARGRRAKCCIEPGHGDPTYIKDHSYKSQVGRLAETTHRQHSNSAGRT